MPARCLSPQRLSWHWIIPRPTFTLNFLLSSSQATDWIQSQRFDTNSKQFTRLCPFSGRVIRNWWCSIKDNSSVLQRLPIIDWKSRQIRSSENVRNLDDGDRKTRLSHRSALSFMKLRSVFPNYLLAINFQLSFRCLLWAWNSCSTLEAVLEVRHSVVGHAWAVIRWKPQKVPWELNKRHVKSFGGRWLCNFAINQRFGMREAKSAMVRPEKDY